MPTDWFSAFRLNSLSSSPQALTYRKVSLPPELHGAICYTAFYKPDAPDLRPLSVDKAPVNPLLEGLLRVPLLTRSLYSWSLWWQQSQLTFPPLLLLKLGPQAWLHCLQEAGRAGGQPGTGVR